jgi:hypothetical protein
VSCKPRKQRQKVDIADEEDPLANKSHPTMFFLLDRRRIGNKIGSVELDPLAPKSGEEKKQEEEGDEWWKQAWHGGEFLHLLFPSFCLSILHYPISSSRRKVQSFPRLEILFVDFLKIRVLGFSFFLFFFLSTVFVGFCMLLLLLTV